MKVLCISFILVRIDAWKNLASDSSINQNWIYVMINEWLWDTIQMQVINVLSFKQ